MTKIMPSYAARKEPRTRRRSDEQRFDDSSESKSLVLLVCDPIRHFEFAIAAEIFALPRPSLGVPWYRCDVVSGSNSAINSVSKLRRPDKEDSAPMTGIAGVTVKPTAGLGALRTAHTIVIPGWYDLDNLPPALLLQELWLANERGARLLSICSGAYVLASAGLLDGKSATTHWLFSDTMQQRFPRVRFDSNVLYVDNGNLITSAGSAAGIDACLHLVRRDYGVQIANTIARRMVTAPHREGGQAQFIEQSVREGFRNADQRLQRVLDATRKNLAVPINVPSLAEHAQMSERSFLRHFHKQIGMTPKNWLQRERMARAQALLEQGKLSQEQIASECGYESSESFRAAFRKHVGLSPQGYRQRFSGDPILGAKAR